MTEASNSVKERVLHYLEQHPADRFRRFSLSPGSDGDNERVEIYLAPAHQEKQYGHRDLMVNLAGLIGVDPDDYDTPEQLLTDIRGELDKVGKQVANANQIHGALPIVDRVRQRIGSGAFVLLTDDELLALADHEATSQEVWALLRDVDHYFPDMGGAVRGDWR